MKTLSYKLLFLFLAIPMIGLAHTDFNGRHTKQKKINKTYTVSGDALLKINNSYGNIDITTWNQNRVEIEVTIKTNGNDEEKVQERLEEIEVEFQNSTSRVSARTRFEKQKSSWWSIFTGGSNNINIEVNYLIKAPASNNVDLTNDYGSISIDKLEGNATINCDYGRIIIGELMGDNNILNFDYTRNSQIDYLKRGKISADYSEISIGEAGTIEVSTDYTHTHIKKVENITFNGDYGSIQLDKVRNLKGQGDYMTTKLGSVYNSVDLDLDYGSASIERLMKNVKRVDIKSDYTSIKVGYDGSSPFTFDIQTSYGNVKGLEGNGFQVNQRHQDNTSNRTAGYYLQENTGGRININTSYGNVTFFKP